MTMESGEMVGMGIRDELMADLAQRVDVMRAEGVMIGLDLLNANPKHAPSTNYVNLKCRQAGSIGIIASPYTTYTATELPEAIERFNSFPNCRGIVVQLPFSPGEEELTSVVVNSIAPEKDVDGLREDGQSHFAPATPNAIVRLLEGHGVDLADGNVAVLGLGKLVGKPLLRLLQEKGSRVSAVDINTDPLERIDILNSADVIVTATGHPSLLTTDIFASMSRRRVLVDAGTAEQGGVLHGDVSDTLRHDALNNGWLVSAKKGSVGPLTVASLLENVVLATERSLVS